MCSRKCGESPRVDWLVFEAHRLLYYSTLGAREMNKKKFERGLPNPGGRGDKRARETGISSPKN